jgi:hypothetical protein
MPDRRGNVSGSDADDAWLEYQVIMGDRLDLEKMTQKDRDLFKAIFSDGFDMGVRYAR